MTDLVRNSITEDAKQAAALEYSYAYAVGTVRAILTSEFLPEDEKVERAVLFLTEFEKERKRESGV